MAEKMHADSIYSKQQPEITGVNKSIIEPWIVVSTNLHTPKEHLERRIISWLQGGYKPYPATGAYSLLYCPMVTVLSAILDCLPSRNHVLMTSSLQAELFSDQLTDDIYLYDYANKFVSSGEINHDMAEDLQRFLRNQNWSG